MNKRGFEMSFAWMFAILLGAVIIFLAVYAATQIVKTERQVGDAEVGKEIGILLNPLETGVESGKLSFITLPQETRLFNECQTSSDRGAGLFGAQDIRVSTKSGIGREWERPSVPVRVPNKYIFSEDIVQGKKYQVFAKPLELPFKVADLIFLWPDDKRYCFVNPNEIVKDELTLLKPRNLNITNRVDECQPGSEKVCFITGGSFVSPEMSDTCTSIVTLNLAGNLKGSVLKEGKLVYFEGPLIYGAIFSDSRTYECQVSRLADRVGELSQLHLAKSERLSTQGCGSGTLRPMLTQYAGLAVDLSSSESLGELADLSDRIGRANELLSCKLF